MAIVNARRVQELLEQGAQLIEVLPREEYEEEHLAGAVNIPLRSLSDEAMSRLDRDRPVVVYCFDRE